MTAAEPLVVYRCSKCGKWSHAQRMPKRHKVHTTDPAEDDVILEELPGYEAETGAYDPGFYVACGPFEAYEAVKVS